MSSSTILVGQVFAILSITLAGIWGGTEWAAFRLGYQPELGLPWASIWSIGIYRPWDIFLWDYSYGAYGPEIFKEAYWIVYGGVIFAVVFAFFGSIWRARRRQDSTTYGSAKWATHNSLTSAGLLSGEGVILGMTESGKYLRHNGPEHVKVVAPTRSGKGIGVVIPTLLTWPSSTLVYDLKCENWNVTAGYRSKFSRVIYFNPSDPTSAHFNPLDEIRKGDFEVRDVQNIADMMVDPEGKGLVDHWHMAAHSFLVGAILHVIYVEKNKSLAGVTDFISDPSRTVEESLEWMLHAKHVDGKTHRVVAAAARNVLNMSEEERSGVLSTTRTCLSLYYDALVARNTADSHFRITDFMESEKPVSLYLVIPPSDIKRLRPLLRLIINQMCRRLTEELNPKEKKQRLLLMLDEFPALGQLDFFESALGVIAGYGIKAMLISQSTNQLEKIYGPKNSILDNTHARVFYAPTIVETAETISRMLGQKTEVHQQRNYGGHRLAPWLAHVMVSDQETARPLLTPGEVMELPETDELIFMAGHPPIRAKKIRYFEDENFSSRVLPPPMLSGCSSNTSTTSSVESNLEKQSGEDFEVI